MSLDLTHLLRVVRRWWWILLLAPMIGGGAAYYSADQQPRMYSSNAVLLISNANEASIESSRNVSETYSGWVVSRPVLEAAAEALGYEGGASGLGDHVTATSIPDTLFIKVSATSDDPDEAAIIANTVADEFILDVQRQTESQHAQVRSDITQQIDDTEADIARLDASIADLNANQTDLTPTESSRLEGLQAEQSKLQTELDHLITTLRSIDVELAAAQTRIVIQAPAVPSSTPYAPDIPRATLIGTALGVVLATAAILVLEYLDDTVRTSDHIALLAATPMLASIPRVPSLRRGGSALFVLDDPKSPAAEAVRMLRAKLDFASAPERLSSLVITSPEDEDGKSTITANLGVVLAQAGLRTVIIDADLRRPSQHQIFGLDNKRGISTLLKKTETAWRQDLIELSIPNLLVIPSGPVPPNPSDLLSLDRFSHALAGLSEWADVVLIDAPPVLAASDALVVSARTRGTLLVCRHGYTRMGELRRATSWLSQGHAKLIGVVMNQARSGEVDSDIQYAADRTRSDSPSGRYYFGKPLSGISSRPDAAVNGRAGATAPYSEG